MTKVRTGIIDPLLSTIVDYSKTSFELIKLKSLDKTAGVVSTIIPQSFVLVAILLVLIFGSVGLAFWLGDMLGAVYHGFFVVAGFYLIAGLAIHFFFFKLLKRTFCNYIIKQALN
jgi:hypothetical protein